MKHGNSNIKNRYFCLLLLQRGVDDIDIIIDIGSQVQLALFIGLVWSTERELNFLCSAMQLARIYTVPAQPYTADCFYIHPDTL